MGHLSCEVHAVGRVPANQASVSKQTAGSGTAAVQQPTRNRGAGAREREGRTRAEPAQPRAAAQLGAAEEPQARGPRQRSPRQCEQRRPPIDAVRAADRQRAPSPRNGQPTRRGRVPTAAQKLGRGHSRGLEPRAPKDRPPQGARPRRSIVTSMMRTFGRNGWAKESPKNPNL
jgi:hypothetical protein